MDKDRHRHGDDEAGCGQGNYRPEETPDSLSEDGSQKEAEAYGHLSGHAQWNEKWRQTALGDLNVKPGLERVEKLQKAEDEDRRTQQNRVVLQGLVHVSSSLVLDHTVKNKANKLKP